MPDQVAVTVIYPDGSENKIWTLKGKTARETLALAGMENKGSCGGRGICGKCKVRISGNVSELSDNERQHLLPEEIKRGDRIACYCIIKGDATVWLDYVNSKEAAPLFKSTAFKGPLSTYSKAVFVPGRDREKPVPLLERLQAALAPVPVELSRDNLNSLNRLDRSNRPALELHALVINNRVRYVGRERCAAYGVALDIGTTSLLAALVDLQSGEVLGVCSRTNMQRVYGENVLSRVSYCLENDTGLSMLQQIILNNVNSMLEELIAQNHIAEESIFRISVVGNPVMLHLFLGLDVAGFATAPYSGLFKSELVYPAGVLGLGINPEAEIIILPQAGSFVGADTIACLVALRSVELKRYLMIDIGTNGELVLNNRGKMWTASAAAGPAFEGEGITCGMRAVQGAIDKIWIKDGQWHYHVIGQEKARGICGSAVVGLAAGLVEAGLVDSSGAICNNSNFDDSTSPSHEIILAPGDNTENGMPMVFTQEDIRQVQLAKAAIRTGIDILLKKAGLNCKDLDNIYLAGAFGNYLDADHCIKIGMLPPIDPNKVSNIGNAAAQGAVMALVSNDNRLYAGKLSSAIQCVELADYKDFQDLFIKNINFPV
jgi:uncharacterized 2Fe-2S/4Fe-4S cluster protein (DUF4445 family)